MARHSTHTPYPHPALSWDISYCAWGLFDLEIVGQTNISLSSSLLPSVNGCSLKVLLNFSLVQATR